MSKGQHSNWTLVKQACIEGQLHQEFFAQEEENQFLIVQLDTDARNEAGYEVNFPEKIIDGESCDELYRNVSLKIDEWLGEENATRTLYAITIEETDAWIFTLHSDHVETGLLANVKEKLSRAIDSKLSKKERNAMYSSGLKATEYHEKSKPFRKKKTLTDCTARNRSLAHFCNLLNRLDEEAG